MLFDYQAGCRRRLKFVPTVDGKRLEGHVILSLSTEKQTPCEHRCLMESRCVSVNIGPSVEDNKVICELNDADHLQYPDDLKDLIGWTYRGTENPCSSNPCFQNGTCANGYSYKGFVCLCPVGYTGEQCEKDIDECQEGSHDCHKDATCINSAGHFNCSCSKGYMGDGRHCADLDECSAQGNNDCSPNAECLNTPGWFDCNCRAGYTGDGVLCNECQDALGMANGAISDGQTSVSSAYHVNSCGSQGRLNFTHAPGVAGGWSAEKGDINQWLQVDFLRLDVTVTRVATQGRSDADEWVTKYKLQYSDNGVDFHNFTEKGQSMDKEFDGNIDRDTVKYQELNPPVRARYFRFRPTAWYRRISIRVELYGCQACNEDLGMKSGAISDGQISASSEMNVNHSASLARLHYQKHMTEGGGWTAEINDEKPWLQVDLMIPNITVNITVTRVATQGRSGDKYWVTKFKLQYSNDGIKFENYTEKEQSIDKEFHGNADSNTVVYHDLNPPIRARYIRFRPTAWHGGVSMRVEIYGCNDTAVTSCQSLRSLSPSPVSGVYWIDPDGGSTANRFKAYCDMETDGGGWTLLWSYHFTQYQNFQSSANAITPRPNWLAKGNVPVSTTPPLSETDYNAMDFALWKQLGSEFLIKSNINNWLICRPGSGSLVDWSGGSVSCVIFHRVTAKCSGAVPFKFAQNKASGPMLYRDEPWWGSTYYYFDSDNVSRYPIHDPCGTGSSNQLPKVDNPHGNIFVR